MPEGKDVPKQRHQRGSTRSFSFNDGDLELLKWGAEFMGTTQADYLRSALRAYTMHMKAIARTRS